MQNLQKQGIIQALVDALQSRGSWTGETHLQKSMYFLQELLRVPTSFDFVLYKHGPYSFDFNEVLSSMRSNGFLDWQPREPYGPSIIPGPLSDRLRRLSAKNTQTFEKQFNFVADKLAKKDVRELERIATALLVSQESSAGIRERALRIHELKSHVSMPEAISAVMEFDSIAKEAQSNSVVLDIEHENKSSAAS